MEKNICKVQYWKEDMKAFSGRAYSYYTSITGLRVGDVVYAPTEGGTQKAVVVEVGCPFETIAEFQDRVKTITELFKEG